MTIPKLTAEMIRNIRGTKSQSFVNQRLSFKSNQIHRWETGQRNISWLNFVKLCKIRKIPLAPVLWNTILYDYPIERTDLLVNHLVLGHTTKQVSRTLDLNYHRVRRWQLMKTEPDLIDVLSLMSLLPGQLENFIIRLCEAGAFAVPKSLVVHSLNPTSVIFRHPIAGALTAVLELDDYQNRDRHSSAEIARLLQTPISEIEECLKALLNSGMVKIDKNGLYKPVEVNIDTSGLDSKNRARLRAFWFERFARQLQSGDLNFSGPSKLSYLLHAVSEAGYTELVEQLRIFYRNVDKIVKLDQRRPKTGVYYVGIDIIKLY